MEHNVSEIRQNYLAGKLMQSELKEDPIEQFRIWLDVAVKTDMPEPTAMNLATCAQDGTLSSRMVLLKDVDERGFVFYTNYESRKADDIKVNTQAALCFWWGILERQVRVEGRVEIISDNESDMYFNSRPRGSQIGAIASKQSAVLNSYQELRNQFKEVEEKYEGTERIPRPEFWGGYRLVPKRIEFWQQGEDRLHDRFVYEKGDSNWACNRLAP